MTTRQAIAQMFTKWSRWCVTAVILLTSSGAYAASGGARVALLPFDGPRSEPVRQIMLFEIAQVYAMIGLAQIRGSINGVDPDNLQPAEWAAMGQALKARAIVQGRVAVSQLDQQWQLRMTVRNAATGQAAGSMSWAGKTWEAMVEEVRADAPQRIIQMIARLSPGPAVASAPPPPPPPAAVRRAAPARAVAPIKPGGPPDPIAYAQARANSMNAGGVRGARGRRGADFGDDDDVVAPSADPLLVISVGARAVSRSFTFTDNIAGLSGHRLPGAPAFVAEGEAYPFSGNQESPLSGVGVAGYWESTIGAVTQGREGTDPLPTRNTSYRIGGRDRIRIGGSRLMIGLDYGQHTFDIAPPAEGEVIFEPNVQYTFVRPSLGVRIPITDRLSTTLNLAYLNVLSVAGLGDETAFPRLTAAGGDAYLQLAYAITNSLEMRISGDVRHYAHSMNVQEGDKYIVGGAVDEYYGGGVTLAYRMD